MIEVSLLDKEWFSLSGKLIPDIRRAIKDATIGTDKVVIIGTDSQASDKKLKFVTVVVVYTVGKGGITFHTRTSVPTPISLRHKLVEEAMLSMRAAWEVEPLLPSSCDLGAIHVDVNPDPKYASSKHYEEVYWMIKGQGFKVITKPIAWAASHVAEHIVKNRPEGRTAHA